MKTEKTSPPLPSFMVKNHKKKKKNNNQPLNPETIARESELFQSLSLLTAKMLSFIRIREDSKVGMTFSIMVQLCMAFPSTLICTALRQRCKDFDSRRTILVSRHSYIGIFKCSRCRTQPIVHSMLYYSFLVSRISCIL
nr:uncharacterized protein LOC114822781 [Malus domestica]